MESICPANQTIELGGAAGADPLKISSSLAQRILVIRALCAATLALLAGGSSGAFAQEVIPPPQPVAADSHLRRFDSSSRTRGLAWGWGHSWSPYFGKTRSDISFVAFHPQMGWFLTDRIELYGEATLFAYREPATGEISAGRRAGRARALLDDGR